MCKEIESKKIKFTTLPYNVNIVFESKEGFEYATEEFIELKGVVHFNGDVTVCVLEDGQKGMTTKGKDDEYDENLAMEVAFYRAYIEFLKDYVKEISSPRIF